MICRKCDKAFTDFNKYTFHLKFYHNVSDYYICPIVLFFDDLETGNPLGSHAGCNKIGAVYVSIASIPPEYSSRLENIFLAMLFHSADRNIFGNKALFNSLIKQLKYLNKHGIDININEATIKVKFSLAVIAGDNLGLHSILGFSESFSALSYCRFCHSTKDQCRTQMTCDDNTKRTVDQYKDDVIQKKGIRENCIWNEINDFHVYNNVYCDVMHDLCEGVHRYGMALIINSLITLKFFTLNQLNDRIKYFDFRVSNKPPLVSKNNLDKGAIMFSASEMLCLVRYFQFLVGDLVPDNDDIWQYYLCLLELTNVIMSQTFSNELLLFLKNLIFEHHERYISLFGGLKPKHHFLVHYPDIIKNIGPPILLSAFKYEAKHLDLKRVSNSINTQKNLPLSLAIKCQLKCCYRFQNKRGLPKVIQHGKVKGERLITELESEDMYGYVKWIVINGIKYMIGDCLLYDYEDAVTPTFCKISQILVAREDRYKFYFYCCYLNTNNFDNHFKSFIVDDTDTWELLKLNNCYSIIPKQVHTILGKSYINCIE
ncbi:hypothetical protein ACJJTC_003500 [Scirpophaga incertulas]